MVSEIWLFFCLVVAVLYPLYDGRHVLFKAGRLAWAAVFGPRPIPRRNETELVEGDTATARIEIGNAEKS